MEKEKETFLSLIRHLVHYGAHFFVKKINPLTEKISPLTGAKMATVA